MPEPAISSIKVRNIAISTDFSPCSDRALQHALAIARKFGATLHILHIVRPSEFAMAPEMMTQLSDLAMRDCGNLIADLTIDHRLDEIDYRCWTMDGEVSQVMGSFIREQSIDLLVVGTRGRSRVPKFLLGSVAHEIFRFAACPVLTVGPWSPGANKRLQLKKVLLSTDLTLESTAAIPYALTASRVWGTQLDVLHVCSSGDSKCQCRLDRLRKMIGNLPDHGGNLAFGRFEMVRGKLSDAVLDFASANHEDLIVLGLDRWQSMYAGPWWSDAYEIVRQAHCPVLSARAWSRPTGHDEALACESDGGHDGSTPQTES